MQTYPNKTPQTALNQQSAAGSLSTLFIRNESASRKYEQAAEATKDESLTAFFKSLSDFRAKLARSLHQVIQDMPSSPMTPTRSSKSHLDQNWDDFMMAIEKDNRTKLTSYCSAEEESLILEYKKALELKGIPVAIHDLLEKQSEKMMEVKRKVERMETVPMLRNNEFEV